MLLVLFHLHCESGEELIFMSRMPWKRPWKVMVKENFYYSQGFHGSRIFQQLIFHEIQPF